MLGIYNQSLGKGLKLKGFTFTLLSVCLAVIAGTKSAEAATLQVVANGLDNPRRITFGPDGALYVSEAGRGGPGPVIAGPELDVLLSFGETGAITRVQNGIQQRVITGLPSLALTDTATAPPEAVGSLSPAVGVHDIGFADNGIAYVLLGYGSQTDQKVNLGEAGTDLGRVIAFDFNSDGSFTRRNDFSVDLIEWEAINNPDNGDLLNNPYDIEIEGSNIQIADPGGNNFYTVDPAGNISLQNVFFPRNVNGFPVDPVPTSITIGPDGAYYIAELTGEPYFEDIARIYRIGSNGEAEIYADGFTSISGIDFDAEGNLYVLEYAANSIADPTAEFTGALTRISPDGVRTSVVDPGEGLIAPNGLTVGPDGALYVSNFSTVIGVGQVVRIDQTVSVPEPTSTLAVLAVGALGLVSLRKSSRKATGGVTTPEKPWVC